MNQLWNTNLKEIFDLFNFQVLEFLNIHNFWSRLKVHRHCSIIIHNRSFECLTLAQFSWELSKSSLSSLSSNPLGSQ